MEIALYGVYTLVVLYQKSHSFASLTCSISDTPQLVSKHRTRALSMKYSIFKKLIPLTVNIKHRQFSTVHETPDMISYSQILS